MALISAREAARRLAVHGLSRSSVQHLLSTGIAGAPVQRAGTHLYDGSAVDDVAARPAVTPDECRTLFPHGALVARLPRNRSVAAADDWPETATALSGPWPFADRPALVVWARHHSATTVPILLTVAGCVMSGALTTSLTVADDETAGRTTSLFELRPPGPWLEPLRGRMLPFGRGAPVELLGPLAALRRDRAGRNAERSRR